MKKHLIAAAVAAAVAVPAAAQVTVSGTLDAAFLETRSATFSLFTGAGAVQGKVKTRNTGENAGFSTSALNFSGSEDLGGGLKASFFFNQSANTDSGALGARDAWLELSGGFGALKLGRFTSVGESTAGAFITGTVLQPGTIDPIFSYDTVDMGRDGGGGNIVYTAPKFGAFTFALSYNETSSDAAATAGKASKRQVDYALNYAAGPLKIGLSRIDVDMAAEGAVSAATVNSLILAANTKGDITVDSIGLSYNFGPAEVRVLNANYKSKAAGVQVSKVNSTQLGVQIPLGATTVYVTAHDGEDKDNGTAANKIDLSGHQVGALYALSKRTTLYAVMGEDKLKTQTASGKIEGAVVGLRHTF